MISDEDLDIVQIIDHKFAADNYIYKITTRGTDDPIWITENNISDNNMEILTSYKEKNIPVSSLKEVQVKTEEYLYNHGDNLALEFNDLLGIKIECNTVEPPLRDLAVKEDEKYHPEAEFPLPIKLELKDEVEKSVSLEDNAIETEQLPVVESSAKTVKDIPNLPMLTPRSDSVESSRYSGKSSHKPGSEVSSRREASPRHSSHRNRSQDSRDRSKHRDRDRKDLRDKYPHKYRQDKHKRHRADTDSSLSDDNLSRRRRHKNRKSPPKRNYSRDRYSERYRGDRSDNSYDSREEGGYSRRRDHYSKSSRDVRRIGGSGRYHDRDTDDYDENSRQRDKKAEETNHKSSIGKVRKATKMSDETREKKAADLFPSGFVASEHKLFEHFSDLSVLDKLEVFPRPVVFEASQSVQELEPVTRQLLERIVSSGSVKLLARYLHPQSGQTAEMREALIGGAAAHLTGAIKGRHTALVAAMLQAGVDIEARNSDGMSPLMVACEMNDDFMVTFLVENGAAVNMKPDGSNKVLYRCTMEGKAGSLRTLLNLGANFTEITTDAPFSVQKWANFCKNGEISEITKQFCNDLKKKLEIVALAYLGSHVQLGEWILPPRVLALHETCSDTQEFQFASKVMPILENNCNFLFLVTGFIQGGVMRFVLSETNKVTSVKLNHVEQQSLVSGCYRTITSLSPLSNALNHLRIKYEHFYNRKSRLVLFGVNVTIK